MGLSNFMTAADGVLAVLVMNTVISVAFLKNMVRSVLQGVSASGSSPNMEEDPDGCPEVASERRISVTQFKSLCHNSSVGSSGGEWATMECCVCLCRFEANEELSELPCKHLFHGVCLRKWFDNKHRTCPLCRFIN